jgi:hypothetical protein
MSGRCFDAIRTMYRRVTRSLLVNGQLTEEFETEVGVPQGAVLSPFLYAVYINGLHKALSDVGLGVWVLGRRVPLLLYADEIVLLARSAVELQAMLDVVTVTVYAHQWRFELNHRKSNVVVMGTSAQKLQSASSGWVLGGRQLEVVNEYKYLGAESGKLAGRWNSLLLRLHGKAQRALAALLYQCGGSNGLRPCTAVAHWKSSVRPVCEYACELWEGEVSDTWVKKLETIQCRCGKAALGLHASPAAVGVRAELGLSELKFRRQILQLRWWARMCAARRRGWYRCSSVADTQR